MLQLLELRARRAHKPFAPLLHPMEHGPGRVDAAQAGQRRQAQSSQGGSVPFPTQFSLPYPLCIPNDMPPGCMVRPQGAAVSPHRPQRRPACSPTHHSHVRLAARRLSRAARVAPSTTPDPEPAPPPPAAAAAAAASAAWSGFCTGPVEGASGCPAGLLLPPPAGPPEASSELPLRPEGPEAEAAHPAGEDALRCRSDSEGAPCGGRHGALHNVGIRGGGRSRDDTSTHCKVLSHSSGTVSPGLVWLWRLAGPRRKPQSRPSYKALLYEYCVSVPCHAVPPNSTS